MTCYWMILKYKHLRPTLVLLITIRNYRIFKTLVSAPHNTQIYLYRVHSCPCSRLPDNPKNDKSSLQFKQRRSLDEIPQLKSWVLRSSPLNTYIWLNPFIVIYLHILKISFFWKIDKVWSKTLESVYWLGYQAQAGK